MYEPDYSNCSLRELYDVKCHIDRRRYPGRYQVLLKNIARLESKSEEHPHGLCEVCDSPLEERYGNLKLSRGESIALIIGMDFVMSIVAMTFCVVFSVAILALPTWLIAGIPGIFYLVIVMILQRKREHLACSRCGTPYQ